MDDRDIHAFALPPLRAGASTEPAFPAPSRPARRRIWPWMLAVLLLLSTLAVVAALMAAAVTAHHVASGATGLEHVQITVDGERWDLDDPAGDRRHPAAAALAVGAAIAVLTLLAVLVFPLALLVAFTVAAGAAGVALLVLAAVLGVVFSPLWLVLLLAWLMLRRRAL